MTESSTTPANDIRSQISKAIHHLEHVLPAQAPIRDFVHHNTLHGFQHLPFQQAIKAASEITGNSGFLPENRFREFFHDGRINLDDLIAIINKNTGLEADKPISDSLRQRDIYLAALLYSFASITPSHLNWQIDENNVLACFQDDVKQDNRDKLLAAAAKHGIHTEAEAIRHLWQNCLEKLNLQHYLFHPEELLELNPQSAEDILANFDATHTSETLEAASLHLQVQKEARNQLGQMLRKVGHDETLRGFLLSLTGQDIQDDIKPTLQRHIANFLDQGMSGWHSQSREQGFYASWRSSAASDLAWIFEKMPEWREIIRDLPDDPLDAMILQLRTMGIPESHWVNYIEQLALEIPGWSGMFLWRHLKPGYDSSGYPVNMLDYLAVRLILERLFAQRLCREYWQIEANLDILRWYFRRRRSEFYVRYNLFNLRLPEYLVVLAQRQLENALINHGDYLPWKQLADMILTWRQSPISEQHPGNTVFQQGWQFFRLAQHLGLCGHDIAQLTDDQAKHIFQCLEDFDPDKRSFIWLQAYERHYSEQFFNAVVNNHNRGRWRTRQQRPEAQVVFCMDDREEGIRRHLEEHNPSIETLGAAGFFGVAINWKGLDDEKVTPLCPVVVTPSHELREVANADAQDIHHAHVKNRRRRLKIKNIIHQETRRSLLTPLLVAAAAPFSFISLVGKSVGYRAFGQAMNRLRDRIDQQVPTHIELTAQHDAAPATPENPRLGFTDTEQADRVQNFLRIIGLQKDFAPFVVMMGHGSGSQNNPHLSAYDCGACSGRHGGPNARAFAVMANRPEIRSILRERGMDIPQDTWFMGAEHNTCDENIQWYDAELIPDALKTAFEKLKADLLHATRWSAHERCRRLASAPKKPTLKKALQHIIGRAYDFSQARPELGHATNAAAIIGRRAISQGAFFDRRVFLISYDPSQDPEGKVLEGILLAAGPVGAGINLEYYFSTVNNEQYGSGSKVTHNLIGNFAVMDGTSSDLRTGLPKQMIEIHEAMRLQVMVEAKIEVLTQIYQRQPPLQELIGKGWLLLCAKDPDSEQIWTFDPDQGFVPWQGNVQPLPEVDTSPQWYDGHHQPLTPALIRQETRHA